MTSILNTLGLGAPSPAAYSDASAVAGQQKQAVAGLQGTLASMSTALMAATSMGFPAQYVNELKQKIADGTSLLTQAATMGPAALQAKTSALESEFAAFQFRSTQNQYNTQVADQQNIINIVEARVTEVKADTTTSPALIAEYDALLIAAKEAKQTLMASPPVYTSPTAASGSSPAYIIPTVLSPSEIQNRLDALDTKKEKETGGGTNFSRLYASIQRWTKVHLIVYLFYITIFCSMILGGIIISNAYAEAESGAVLNRLFYFVYGAIAYPIALIYACIPGMPTSILKPMTAWPGKTPYWSAGLFPLYQRVPVITIPAGGSTETPDIEQTGGNLLSMFTSAKKAAAKAAGIAIEAEADLTTSSNGVDTFTKESVVKNKDGSIQRSNEIQPVGIVQRLFSFVIVDSKNPAPYQATNRNTLLYASGTFLVGNLLFLIRYGLI